MEFAKAFGLIMGAALALIAYVLLAAAIGNYAEDCIGTIPALVVFFAVIIAPFAALVAWDASR